MLIQPEVGSYEYYQDGSTSINLAYTKSLLSVTVSAAKYL
uniref:Uncharacterized protein n=1 Tax=Arundo donax TaxID=35708 RepID=A0A0A9B8K0_ARUDO